MKKYLLAICAIGITLPAIAALGVGDRAALFKAQASLDGEAFEYSLQDALEHGPVVVYFFPSAYTSGCNIQAHEFAVNMDAFNAAGASVIGVSLDDIDRLNDFSADPEFCAGKLPIASDIDGQIARSYDVTVRDPRPGKKDTRGVEIHHGFATRTTFIVDSDGTIATVIDGVSAFDNVALSLAAVQELAEMK